MIRKSNNQDTEAIFSVWNKASSLAHPFLEKDFVEQVKKDMLEIYIPNAETWVYEKEGEVVGFISMLDNEIGGLFVEPEEHSNGIGTELVDYVSGQFDSLEVEVFEDNSIGRAFYEKYGFRQIRRYMDDNSGCIVCRLLFSGPAETSNPDNKINN